MDSMEKNPETEPLEEDEELFEDEDDVIVIKKSFLVNVVVAFVALLIGAGGGFALRPIMLPASAAQAPSQAQVAQQQQVVPTQPPSRLDNVSVDDDPRYGPADALVTIVEFSDFNCGYCKRFHDDTLPQLLELYEGQINLVYRDFPVVGGQAAAEASECANAQGIFWDYHDDLFANQGSLNSTDAFVSLAENYENVDAEAFRACIDDATYRAETQNDAADGRAYGVTGTPTFFVNGLRLVGAQPLSVFQQIIDQELEAAK